MKGRVWTDAEMLTALQLRDQGLSAAAIGRAMGFGRNAVRGTLFRIDRDSRIAEGDDV